MRSSTLISRGWRPTSCLSRARPPEAATPREVAAPHLPDPRAEASEYQEASAHARVPSRITERIHEVEPRSSRWLKQMVAAAEPVLCRTYPRDA